MASLNLSSGLLAVAFGNGVNRSQACHYQQVVVIGGFGGFRRRRRTLRGQVVEQALHPNRTAILEQYTNMHTNIYMIENKNGKKREVDVGLQSTLLP